MYLPTNLYVAAYLICVVIGILGVCLVAEGLAFLFKKLPKE